MICDPIAANLGIAIDDFECVPFNIEGGLGKVHQLFWGGVAKGNRGIESGVGGIIQSIK